MYKIMKCLSTCSSTVKMQLKVQLFCREIIIVIFGDDVVKYNIEIDPHLFARLNDAASFAGLGLNEKIIKLITEYVEGHEWVANAFQECLAEVVSENIPQPRATRVAKIIRLPLLDT